MTKIQGVPLAESTIVANTTCGQKSGRLSRVEDYSELDEPKGVPLSRMQGVPQAEIIIGANSACGQKNEAS
jgi:hypothetical protein